MKKTIITSLTALALSTAQAAYTINIPFELNKRGALENGTIKFINKQPTASENWMTIAPLESEWVNVGQPLNCTNWSPEPSTVALGKRFTQTATDCEQNQTRTIQQREQEAATFKIRNIGSPTIENRTTVVEKTRGSEGLTEPWPLFADDKRLSKDWNMLSWGARNLTEIPSTPYPLTSVYRIDLYNNQLTNVDGFRNLTSVNTIWLYNNQLTNVDGFRNLTSVTYLYLYNNQLTNVDGLSNVKASRIAIDNTYSGPKLAASTRFCSLNAPSVFSHAQKSQLCNS